MSSFDGYRLSPQAAAAEVRYRASRELETRAYPPILYPGMEQGRQDGANFRANLISVVSLERHADGSAATKGAALGLSATFACVSLIAGTVGSLPLVVYRTDARGVRTVARDHPLYWLLHDSPNYDQTALDFWEYQSAAIELTGNAYAQIERRGDGVVVSLTPLRPDTMQVARTSAGELEYRWNDGGARVADQADILHIRGFGGNALGGASPLTLCRQPFGAAMATDQAAASMFANGVRPSGHMSTEKQLSGEQRATLEALLQEKFVGSHNTGRPMLLDGGLKWEQITIDPTDAQMLESRKFSGEEICRIFGVPPAMVGYGDKASNWGTGKEVDVLGFQKFTLRRRLKRIEMALEKQLLSRIDRRAGITIEFNLEGLLRGDSDARSKFYQSGLMNGWLTINEVRRRENLPPVAGGDTPRMQMQNQPITAQPGIAETSDEAIDDRPTPDA